MDGHRGDHDNGGERGCLGLAATTTSCNAPITYRSRGTTWVFPVALASTGSMLFIAQHAGKALAHQRIAFESTKLPQVQQLMQHLCDNDAARSRVTGFVRAGSQSGASCFIPQR